MSFVYFFKEKLNIKSLLWMLQKKIYSFNMIYYFLLEYVCNNYWVKRSEGGFEVKFKQCEIREKQISVLNLIKKIDDAANFPPSWNDPGN